MFIPDKTKKTVRLLVQIKAGLVVRDDLTPLPKVREGTFADLTFPASSLVDESEREELVEESSLELLPAFYSVFVGLNPNLIKGKHRGLIKPADLKIERQAPNQATRNGVLHAPRTLAGHGYLRFAEVVLVEPLTLRLRGNKESTLELCKCAIPVLNVEARSLNHAFTLLSTKFETDRISHTGNVFAHVFFRDKTHWHSLNEARGKVGDGTDVSSLTPEPSGNADKPETGVGKPDIYANKYSMALLASVVAELRRISERIAGDDSPLADPWEEIKSMVQGELSVYWPIVLETIEKVIYWVIHRLGPEELLALSTTLKVSVGQESRISRSLLKGLLAKAKTEKLRYKPFDFEYIHYSIEGVSIYAEIIERTGLSTCQVLAYSKAAPSGERCDVDLSMIDRMKGIRTMSADDFEKATRLNCPDRLE